MFSNRKITRFKSIATDLDAIDKQEEKLGEVTPLILPAPRGKLYKVIDQLNQFFPVNPSPSPTSNAKSGLEDSKDRSIYTPTPPNQTKNGETFTRSLSPSFRS